MKVMTPKQTAADVGLAREALRLGAGKISHTCAQLEANEQVAAKLNERLTEIAHGLVSNPFNRSLREERRILSDQIEAVKEATESVQFATMLSAAIPALRHGLEVIERGASGRSQVLDKLKQDTAALGSMPAGPAALHFCNRLVLRVGEALQAFAEVLAYRPPPAAPIVAAWLAAVTFRPTLSLAQALCLVDDPQPEEKEPPQLAYIHFSPSAAGGGLP